MSVIEEVSVSVSTGAPRIAVGPEGTLVRLTHVDEGEFVPAWIEPSNPEPRRLEVEANSWIDFQPDPAGRRLAVWTAGQSPGWRGEIWVHDLRRGVSNRVSEDGILPRWSPDGRRLAFVTTRQLRDQPLRYDLRSARSDGSRQRILLQETPFLPAPGNFSPNGRHLFIAMADPATTGERSLGNTDLWRVSADGSVVERLLETPWDEGPPRVSPDGSLIAFPSDRSGRYEVYLRRIRGDGPGLRVSPAGGISPRWMQSGSRLAYWEPETRFRGRMMAVDLQVPPEGEIQAGRPVVLFEGDYTAALDGPGNPIGNTFSVLPDGRFLMWHTLRPPEAEVEIVLHWDDEVRRLLASDPY